MRVPRTWALVADATRARIVPDVFRGVVSTARLKELQLRAAHHRLRDIMADKPGRSFASVGTRRSAMEYRSDPVREETKAFAEAIVAALEHHRAAGEFEKLAVFAAPHMLGFIREAMSEPLRVVVISEFAKDLTKLPARDLRQIVRTLTPRPLPVGP